MAQRWDTAEQLRHDIDRGRTHDKVRGGDPAVAPLGTDEEAAGAPVPPQAVSAARRAERGRGDVDAEEEAAIRRRRLSLAALAVLMAALMFAVWAAP